MMIVRIEHWPAVRRGPGAEGDVVPRCAGVPLGRAALLQDSRLVFSLRIVRVLEGSGLEQELVAQRRGPLDGEDALPSRNPAILGFTGCVAGDSFMVYHLVVIVHQAANLVLRADLPREPGRAIRESLVERAGRPVPIKGIGDDILVGVVLIRCVEPERVAFDRPPSRDVRKVDVVCRVRLTQATAEQVPQVVALPPAR